MEDNKKQFVFMGRRKDNGQLVFGDLIQCEDDKYILPFEVTEDKLDYQGNLEPVQVIEVEDVALFNKNDKEYVDTLADFLYEFKTSIEDKLDYMRFALKLMR